MTDHLNFPPTCSMPGCPHLAVARFTNSFDDGVDYACEAHIPTSMTAADGTPIAFLVTRF
jgi:hypothetical protein